MNRRLAILGVIVVAVAVLLSDTFFTVNQAEQALVFRFGDHRRTVRDDPGLHMKVPFLENVVYYDARILDVDPPAEEVTLLDRRRLVVDSFVRYRIINPLLFYQRVSTESGAVNRLTTILSSSLRGVLANYTQPDVLSEVRDEIMLRIRQEVASRAASLGIDIVDVRIGRADVPDQTRESIFNRMRTEREREAGEIRAEGDALSEQLRALADRWQVGFLARSRRLAEIIRGEGDRDAIRILSDAHSLDEEFFSFYRTLEAYRQAMATQETALVLSPDGDFFRYFRDLAGGTGTLPTSNTDQRAMTNIILPRLIPTEGEAGEVDGDAFRPEAFRIPEVLRQDLDDLGDLGRDASIDEFLDAQLRDILDPSSIDEAMEDDPATGAAPEAAPAPLPETDVTPQAVPDGDGDSPSN